MSTRRKYWALVLGLPLLLPAIGCSPPAHFESNAVYMHTKEVAIKEEFSQNRKQEVANAMAALFGTPDEPHLPQLEGNPFKGVLSKEKVVRAAGKVALDPEGQKSVGLYREHCSHCHGVTGGGDGPTASFLNPYPRDFRKGVFKFKSNAITARPTHEDLMKTLELGIPGTAMPSFKLLDGDEVDALAHYLKYLAIRGQVERILWDTVADLEAEEPLFDYQNPTPDQISQLQSFVVEVVEEWQAAPESVVDVPERTNPPTTPEEMKLSVERGRELFHGKVANCASCHGSLALGDGRKDLWDEWTTELKPDNEEELAEYIERGAHKPRHVLPRNLRSGVYRGGRRPIDIYWRIHNGIAGSGMPAASMKADDAPASVKGLTEEDLWSIIDYVFALPYEPLSTPKKNVTDNMKERAS